MDNLNIAMLDTGTLGDDLDFSMFEKLGKLTVYDRTAPEDVKSRLENIDVLIVNKIKLNSDTLCNANNLRLICVTATGYDNIDINYCREHSIAVCNVCGYSSDSVAQITMAMALSLVNNITRFGEYVKSGEYTNSGMQNRVTPVFHEMNTLTWGIIGLGGIGKRTAELAESFGCEVIAFKRTPDPGYNCVSLDELLRVSDIISIHVPLTDDTFHMINEANITKMKKTAILINVARGAVVDEEALVKAIENNEIGGVGVDVYSREPMAKDSPYQRIKDYENVILTPHMAWAAYEARIRCMNEIAKNIKSFYNNEIRNRVDI